MRVIPREKDLIKEHKTNNEQSAVHTNLPDETYSLVSYDVADEDLISDKEMKRFKKLIKEELKRNKHPFAMYAKLGAKATH